VATSVNDLKDLLQAAGYESSIIAGGLAISMARHRCTHPAKLAIGLLDGGRRLLFRLSCGLAIVYPMGNGDFCERLLTLNSTLSVGGFCCDEDSGEILLRHSVALADAEPTAAQLRTIISALVSALGKHREEIAALAERQHEFVAALV
jgi:hypothetical protein